MPRESKAPIPVETNEARFAFTGAVDQSTSSSLFFVPLSGGAAAVRIERSHRSPPAFRSQRGTVLFGEGSGSAEERRVFLTNSIL